jgi:hypothetical protein
MFLGIHGPCVASVMNDKTTLSEPDDRIGRIVARFSILSGHATWRRETNEGAFSREPRKARGFGPPQQRAQFQTTLNNQKSGK